MTKKKNSLCITAPMLVFATLTMPATVSAEDIFWKALTGGKIDLYLRYRFEHVDDGDPVRPDPANAHTLRTALGYSTGLFYNLGAYVQFQDVRVIGNEDFEDGSNNKPQTAQVVDPEGTEVHQANLRYEGVPKTVLRFGRQEIEHRQAPLHRYIGNILWRQHWQSFDGIRALSQYLPDTVMDYAYIWNVNRIFGERNPIPDRSHFRIDGHLINIQYKGLKFIKFESYAYLLDFNSDLVTTTRFSTQTYGLRIEGPYDLVPGKWKLIYTGEFANQRDYGDNPFDIDVNYYLGELGFTFTPGGAIELITVKGSYEVLEGDGGFAAFQTPLGTNHAFQGWADRFLITPGDGIDDAFATFATKIYGFQFVAMYHDLSSNRDGYDYGTELDLQLTKTFKEHYTVGLKYADYDADENILNLQRNGLTSTGRQAFDLTKFWAWVEIKF
jgi:Alginate export